MSSLLEPDSSFVQSTSAESTTESTKIRSKKWKSPVWEYCRRPTADENQDFLFCAHCPPIPTPEDYKGLYSIDLLTNMKGHLLRHYNIIIEKPLSKNQVVVNQQLKQLYHQAEATGDTNKL